LTHTTEDYRLQSSEPAMADFEQAKREAQDEKNEERAKLFLPVGNQASEVEGTVEDQPRVVDEIESLCMNCEENVS
jgi:hypothetical protein